MNRKGTDLESLRKLLTRSREDLGLTRREVAETTGLSRTCIRTVENGERGHLIRPSYDTLQRLVALYDLDPTAFGLAGYEIEPHKNNGAVTTIGFDTDDARRRAHKSHEYWSRLDDNRRT